MGKKTNRRHAPISVSEAEELLAKARRREAAQAAQAAQIGHNTRRPARVDLATLDTPEISHGDLWDDFMMRPGTFYVADIAIPDIANADGNDIFTATTTLKATDEQLPYLVEVLRQVRGALGETCRISLAAAEQTDHSPRVQQTGRYALREMFDQQQSATENANQSTASIADAERALHAARRAARGRARAIIPDGPPMVIGGPDGPQFVAPGPPGELWIPAEDREYSREELAAQLPGRTRADVAAELGKAPEDIGGTYNTDAMPEELAAQLGVPVESLRRIPMTGGGHAWAVVPQTPEPSGRHAATETVEQIAHHPGLHSVYQTILTDGEGERIVCNCGDEFTDTPELSARDAHGKHRDPWAGR